MNILTKEQRVFLLKVYRNDTFKRNILSDEERYILNGLVHMKNNNIAQFRYTWYTEREKEVLNRIRDKWIKRYY